MNIDHVEKVSDIAARNGTAIVVSSVFLVIVGIAVIYVLTESKKDREAERKRQELDDEHRFEMFTSQTKQMREMTETLVESNHATKSMLGVLDRTRTIHDELDVKVEKIVDGIAEVKEEVVVALGEEGHLPLKLDRVEHTLQNVLEEIKSMKEVARK